LKIQSTARYSDFVESLFLDKWRELYIQPSYQATIPDSQATIPDSQAQASSNKRVVNY